MLYVSYSIVRALSVRLQRYSPWELLSHFLVIPPFKYKRRMRLLSSLLGFSNYLYNPYYFSHQCKIFCQIVRSGLKFLEYLIVVLSSNRYSWTLQIVCKSYAFDLYPWIRIWDNLKNYRYSKYFRSLLSLII